MSANVDLISEIDDYLRFNKDGEIIETVDLPRFLEEEIYPPDLSGIY